MEQAQTIEITSDQLREMTDGQLAWCCVQAGIGVRPGWSKTRMLTTMMGASLKAENY
jgi:hypothetical protein